MPKRKLLYTDQYPYHITARANNREWFKVPMKLCWYIFKKNLNLLSIEYNLLIHSFVLMNNHYHLIASTHKDYPLNFIMNRLQTNLSNQINKYSGRINHVFGGTYKASLIRTPIYYAHATKYLFQNPLKENLCSRVQDYEFSTLKYTLDDNLRDLFLLEKPSGGIDHILETMNKKELLEWYNTLYDDEAQSKMKLGFCKTEFKVSVNQNTKKDHWLTTHLTQPTPKRR